MRKLFLTGLCVNLRRQAIFLRFEISAAVTDVEHGRIYDRIRERCSNCLFGEELPNRQTQGEHGACVRYLTGMKQCVRYCAVLEFAAEK